MSTPKNKPENDFFDEEEDDDDQRDYEGMSHEEWCDLYCDANGNCWSDADPGL